MYSTHRVNTVGLPNWMQRRKEPQLMWKWSSNLSQPRTGVSLHYHNTSLTLRVPGTIGGGNDHKSCTDTGIFWGD